MGIFTAGASGVKLFASSHSSVKRAQFCEQRDACLFAFRNSHGLVAGVALSLVSVESTF